MPFLNLGDSELYYEEKGQGQPLLFVHAGIADARMWDEQFETFSQNYRVIRCDLRGFGRSPYPDAAFAHYEDLNILCETLDLENLCCVGASFGGGAVLDFYLSHPQKVKAIGLVSPAISGFRPSEVVRAFGKREDELLEADKLGEAVELNLQMWVEGPKRRQEDVDPKLRALVGDMQLKVFKLPHTENTAISRLDPPAITRLDEIRVPLLVITGALDEASFVQLGQTIVRQVPNARGVTVPDAAHLVSMEAPEIFDQLLGTFLDEVNV